MSSGVARAAAAAVLVLAALAGPRAAVAQPQPHPQPRAAVATGSPTGLANAAAKAFGIAPGVGGVELEISFGQAISGVQNSLSQGQVASMNFGLLGTALTGSFCNAPSFMQENPLPKPTNLSNRDGEATERNSVAPEVGPAGASQELVEVTPQPWARSTYTGAGASVGPTFQVGNTRAVSIAEIVDNVTQRAHAVVTSDLAIAQVFELRGMRWDASYRTGTAPAKSGSFTVAGATVLGQPIASGDPADVEAAANTALAPLGVKVIFPVVDEPDEGVGVVRVSPMKIVLGDSASSAVTGPVFEATREFREDIIDRLSEDCSLSMSGLASDIVLGYLTGTTQITFNLGGVSASSAPLAFTDPFGDAPPSDADAGPGTPSTSVIPGAPAVAPGVATDPSTTRVSGPPAVIAAVCESVHPNRAPGCSSGLAVAFGLVAILATSGALAFDGMVRRRRSPEGPGPT